VSKRTRVSLFLISCLLVILPDIAALITRATISAAIADPDPAQSVTFLSTLPFFLSILVHPACQALTADPIALEGTFCGYFAGLTLIPGLICLSGGVTLWLLSSPAPGRHIQSHKPRRIGIAGAISIALLGTYKALTMSLAYFAPRGAFDFPAVWFCANFFAVDPVIDQPSCAPPMTAYFWLSSAMLVPAVAGWLVVSLSRSRAEQR
jgi:hypothetical protein